LNADGTLGERYTYGPGIDEPLVGQRQPKIFFYEADGLGSVTSLTDPTGAVAATYTYDSFGFLTSSTGSATNWFRYTARQFDSDTALYYYRARYYDPTIGRFISEDPIGFKGGMNFYGYAGNNPVNKADPTGLCPVGKKMTPEQCQAAQTLLNREAQYGTTVAAWQSAIGFGDGAVQPFNSSVPGNAYTQTALGPVKVDWFTDLRLTTLIPGPQIPAYIFGKLTWTGLRLATGAPVTNYLPFQDPVETRTMTLALQGYGFRDLFPPDFMAENCGE